MATAGNLQAAGCCIAGPWIASGVSKADEQARGAAVTCFGSTPYAHGETSADVLELTGTSGPVAVAAARRRDGWGLVVMLATAHCLAFSDRLLVAALAPAIKASLRLSDFQLGILQGSAFVFAYAAASLGLAWLGPGTHAPRVVRLRVIIASVLVWSTATVLCGVAPTFLALLAARILLGLGQAALSPAALSLIAGILPAALTARGVSVYTAGSTLGRSTALIGGGAVMAYVGLPLVGPEGAWRAVFVLAVVPNLLLAACLAAIPEPSRPPVTAREASVSAWLRQARPMLTSLVLASAATVLVIQTVTAWTTSLLVRQHHLTIAAAGTLFGTIVLVAAPLGHLGGGLLLGGLAGYGYGNCGYYGGDGYGYGSPYGCGGYGYNGYGYGY